MKELKHFLTGLGIIGVALTSAYSVSFLFYGQKEARAATVTLYADDCTPYGSGSGTSGDPYCGIQTAIDAIPTNLAGDAYVIEVKSGTYIEAIAVAGKTTSATETIIIREQSGQTAVIDGDTLSTWGIHVDGVDYVTIDGFEIMNTYYDGIKCDAGGNYNTYKNNNIHGVKASAVAGIWLGNGLGSGNGCTNATVQTNQLHDNAVEGFHAGDDSVDFLVTGNDVYLNASNGINIVDDADGGTIWNNTIYQNTVNGVRLDTVANTTVQGNTIYQNGDSGVQTFAASTTLIDDNEIYNNSQVHTRSAILVSTSSSATTITNNIVHNESNNGINLSDTSTGSIVRYNAVLNSGQGINMSANPSFTVDHNLVYNNTMGMIIFPSSAPSPAVVSYNTIYGNVCMGMLLGAGSSSNYPTVSNNIFANNATASGCNAATGFLTDNGFGGVGVDNSNTAPYGSLQYNLFYNNGWNVDAGNEHVVELNVGTFSRGGYYATAEAINGIETTLPNMLSANNTVGDPLLTDPDGADNNLATWADNDFHEGLGGAAIDAADPGDSYDNEPMPNGGRANLGRYGNTDEAASASSEEENETIITASVDPYISYTISSNTCALGGGSLMPGVISTCNYILTVGTNATNGYSSSIIGDATLTSGADSIAATDGTITNGSEEYGIATSKAGVDISQFSGTCDDPETSPMTASALSGTPQSVVDQPGPVAGDATTLCHAAAVNAVTPAGTYSGTATLSVTANF